MRTWIIQGLFHISHQSKCSQNHFVRVKDNGFCVGDETELGWDFFSLNYLIEFYPFLGRTSQVTPYQIQLSRLSPSKIYVIHFHRMEIHSFPHHTVVIARRVPFWILFRGWNVIENFSTFELFTKTFFSFSPCDSFSSHLTTSLESLIIIAIKCFAIFIKCSKKVFSVVLTSNEK